MAGVCFLDQVALGGEPEPQACVILLGVHGREEPLDLFLMIVVVGEGLVQLGGQEAEVAVENLRGGLNSGPNAVYWKCRERADRRAARVTQDGGSGCESGHLCDP